MFKKIIAGLLTVIMVFSLINTTLVYAFENYQAKTIVDTTIRKTASSEAEILKKIKKGTVLTIIGEEKNNYDKLWCKVQGGGYIYSEKIKKISSTKPTITLNYVPVNYQVKAKVDTTIRTGYYEVENILRKVKKGEILTIVGEQTNKYDKLWLKVQGGGYIYSGKVEKVTNSTKPSITPSAETNNSLNNVQSSSSNSNTSKHNHNYQRLRYGTLHPHTAEYKCTSCESAYSKAGETIKVKDCKKCYPHEHNYQLLRYGTLHPHTAEYKCTSCESAYSKAGETTKVKDCSECYPYGYGNDHFCEYEYTGEHLNEHPHYAINECAICRKQEINLNKTKTNSTCSICNNPFKDKAENYPDFYGRIYDLSTGEIIYTPEVVSTQELYSFAEQVHISLDLLGLIPAIGEVFDGINAIYYIVEGDYVDAALSGASMVPFIGVVSTSGKIYKRAGKVTIDAAEGTYKALSSKISKEILEEALKKNTTNTARNIVRDADRHSETLLRTIKSITENKSLKFSDIYYKNEILISRNYRGTVTTSSGLKYAYIPEENRNAIYHILDQHSLSMVGKGKKNDTHFNINGKDIITLIDDLYSNSNRIISKQRSDGRTVHIVWAERIIGSNGEDKLKLILEGEKVVSAYPTIENTLK